MECRSLVYRYWISFDDEGEIKAFYKNKYESEGPCQEFVVKLLPINRSTNESIDKVVDAVEQESKKVVKSINNLNTEFSKAVKGLKGVLK